jgi:hypothetical protein
MTTMADIETSTGFLTVSAEEYVAQIAEAVRRGDAPAYMADGIRHALDMAYEREASDGARSASG